MKIAGILLIVIGALVLVYQGFTYTETKKDVQIGSLEINHQEHHSVWIPPVVGAVCVAGGVAAFVAGAKTNS